MVYLFFFSDDLKTLVYAQSGIPCCQQNFSGWPNNQYPSNKDLLSKLNLPDKFKLKMNSGGEDSNPELNGGQYVLNWSIYFSCFFRVFYLYYYFV